MPLSTHLRLIAALLATCGAVWLRGAPASASAPAPADQTAKAKTRALPPKRVYHAVRLIGPPPKVDGKLADPCWSQGAWAGNYIQREPHEGQPGSQPTQLKILYDDTYVYVAIRAYDSEIGSLQHLRGKRDEFVGDGVGVAFDSYFDRRTGFEFDVTAGGSKVDGIDRNDSWDVSWNAVWDVKVATEPDAWTAEYRIPLSQLRYSSKDEQIWGLHSWRWLQRFQEESDWQFIPMDNPGFVYSFGELHGIHGLKPSRRIELLPYVLAKYAALAKEAGNPYRKGAEFSFEAGLDAKVGLSNNVTLDLTVNPDFGQVESDPSVVNLTPYESFFEEKRPFFLEGKNIFEYGIGDDLLFYSRRIGHAPSFDPATNGYKQTPANTRILGAAKVTGKTPNGLSVGVIYGLTDRETARITEDGGERRQTVEPLTSYWLARVQQDFDKGNTIVGGIAAVTARNIRDDALGFLPSNAYTGGVDLLHYWDDRTYYLDLKAVGSRLEGSTTALRALMENPVHNFQRPDATHLGVDPDTRHLVGTGGQFKIGKGSNGHWRYYGSVDWRSPGLELNDLGYLKTADQITESAKLEYVDTLPASFHRRYSVRLVQARKYDFGGTRLEDELWSEGELVFNNNWSVWGHLGYDSDSLDTRVLRGGPALKIPARINVWGGYNSDSSKNIRTRLELAHLVSTDGRSRYTQIAPSVFARFLNIINFEARVSYEHDIEDLQYAGTAPAAGSSHYVLGRMDQSTLGATVRFEVNLTPQLSLTYYGNPYVSSGRFADFKLVTSPRATRYTDRFRRIDAITRYDAANATYTVNDNGSAFTFATPDFNSREFKSNLVLRWEYKTGSTLYLVWNQYRTDTARAGDFSAASEYRRLFQAHPDNTFLIKFSYWFSL